MSKVSHVHLMAVAVGVGWEVVKMELEEVEEKMEEVVGFR